MALFITTYLPSTYRPIGTQITENIKLITVLQVQIADDGAYIGNYRVSQNRNAKNTQTTRSISRTYLFRPLPSLGAKSSHWGAETDLSSNIFDGFSHNGATALASDDRMVAINCVAMPHKSAVSHQTNATVTVSHSGRVIYQTKVALAPCHYRSQPIGTGYARC